MYSCIVCHDDYPGLLLAGENFSSVPYVYSALWEGSLSHRQQQERAEWLADERRRDQLDIQREEEEQKQKILEEKKKREEEEKEKERIELEREQNELFAREQLKESVVPSVKKTSAEASVEVPVESQLVPSTPFKMLTLKLADKGGMVQGVPSGLVFSSSTGKQQQPVVASIFSEMEDEDEHGGKK